MVAILLASAVGIVTVHDRRVKQETPATSLIEVDPNVKSLHKLMSFFHKHDTLNPGELAVALLLTPPSIRYTLAAIAVRETNGDPTVKIGRAHV